MATAAGLAPYLAHLATVDDHAKRVQLANDLASGTLRGRPAREGMTRRATHQVQRLFGVAM